MALNSSKRHRMLACIPLIFAVQQAAEGLVWLTMAGGHATLNGLAVSIFLGVALVVWPTWSPLALKRAELNPSRRRALDVLIWMGGVVSLSAVALLVGFRPVPQIAGHSIRYDYAALGDAPSHVLLLLAYLIPTVVPFFVSTLSLARWIGALLVVSLLLTFLARRNALISVWCFFAAILSVLLVVAIAREQRSSTFERAAPRG